MATIYIPISALTSMISGSAESLIISYGGWPSGGGGVSWTNSNYGTMSATEYANQYAPIFEVYKGTPPTSFTTFTNYSSRSTDLLFRINVGYNGSAIDETGASTTHKIYRVGKRLTEVTASGTGTATWFLLRANSSTAFTSINAIMGTVGDIGSGADVEIANTSITSGKNYMSFGFPISFPVAMTI